MFDYLSWPPSLGKGIEKTVCKIKSPSILFSIKMHLMRNTINLQQSCFKWHHFISTSLDDTDQIVWIPFFQFLSILFIYTNGIPCTAPYCTLQWFCRKKRFTLAALHRLQLMEKQTKSNKKCTDAATKIIILWIKAFTDVTNQVPSSHNGIMMMPWQHVNTFHITGPLWGESTGLTGGFPSQRASNAELLCFLEC